LNKDGGIMKKLLLGILAVFVVFAMLGCQQEVTEDVTIRFNLDYDAAPDAPQSIAVKFNEPVGDTLPVPENRDGYNFAGWLLYSNGDWIPVTGNTAFKASTTLYARWAEDVPVFITFHLNYVAPEAQTRVEHTSYAPIGEKIPEDPLRENFTFLGWFRNSQGTGNKITASDTFMGDNIVYASWQDDRPDVTISFNVNFPKAGGPKTPESVTIKSGDKITQEKIPVIENMVNDTMFQGWFTERTGGTRVERATVFTANTAIYAQWISPKVITLTPANRKEMDKTDAPFTPTPEYEIEEDGSLTAVFGDFGSQGILFELTEEQKAEMDALSQGDQILVMVDGTVDNEGSYFRMYLCRTDTGANWNGTATHTLYPNVFSAIKEITLEFGTNKNENTTEYFVIQWMSSGDPKPVTINIKSIKIYY